MTEGELVAGIADLMQRIGFSGWKFKAEERWPNMSVARVTEIIASSKKGFDDAVAIGVKKANATLRNVSGAWIQDHKIVVTEGKITEYRVNMKVTFVLEE